MIYGVAVDARPFGNQLLNFRPHPPNETRRRLARTIAWLVRKNSPQIVVEICGPFERVLLSLPVVMFAQRDPDFRQGFDFLSHPVLWTRARDLVHQLINVFKLS